MLLKLGMKVLSPDDIEKIVNTAFIILQNTGVLVEQITILDHLEAFGGSVDETAQRVRFSRSFLEQFAADSRKIIREETPISFSAFAGVYHGYFLDPEDGAYRPWTEERLLNYAKLAKALPNVDGMSMLGCPIQEVPVHLQPLYEKLYCWKYGIEGGSAIWTTELCPQIYDLWQAYADETGKDIHSLYNGTVYVISPLKFGQVEADQFLYFYEKGLRTRVGNMAAVGGTTPVTLAGALALQLAECLFVSILNRAFFQSDTIYFSSSIPVLDMSSGAFQYGRPEQSLLSIAGAQIADYLGADFGSHGGLSDAKAPGHEAGVQKAYSAMINGVISGHGSIEAGLLGVDEIFSPVQMILDDEVTGAFKRIAQGFEVDEEALAAEVVHEVGPGGKFLDTMHTAVNFRQSLWQPSLWSREMYTVWDSKGRPTEVDKARKKYRSILEESPALEPQLSEDFERRLLQIIKGGKRP